MNKTLITNPKYIWEEKNLTELEKNCSNSSGTEQTDIIKNTNIDLIMSQWKDTVKERNLKKSKKLFRKRFTDKEPFRWVYTVLKSACKTYNKKLELTFDDFLTFVNIKTCHYCEAPITWHPRSSSWNVDGTIRIKHSQSYYLDRMDNALGYSKDNCVVCCSLCNSIKGDKLTYSEMLLLKTGIKQIRNLRTNVS